MGSLPHGPSPFLMHGLNSNSVSGSIDGRVASFVNAAEASE